MIGWISWLGAHMSAHRRRKAPMVIIVLDVFKPGGEMAVFLEMGNG